MSTLVYVCGARVVGSSLKGGGVLGCRDGMGSQVVLALFFSHMIKRSFEFDMNFLFLTFAMCNFHLHLPPQTGFFLPLGFHFISATFLEYLERDIECWKGAMEWRKGLRLLGQGRS